MSTTPLTDTRTSLPFLLAVCRRPGPIADDELTMIRSWGGLRSPGSLETLCLLDPGAPDPADAGLDRYAGVIITGSPLSLTHPSDDPGHPLLVDRALRLAARLVAEDVPTLGLCFGLQAITLALGGSLREDVGEDLQAPTMTLTPEGATDPVTRGLPASFQAYVGHSQSVGVLPGDGTVLATGTRCPVQMARWGRNVYGTQFHPEITTPGMRLRVDAYGDQYYQADEAAAVRARCDAADVTAANGLVTAFVRHHAR